MIKSINKLLIVTIIIILSLRIHQYLGCGDQQNPGNNRNVVKYHILS